MNSRATVEKLIVQNRGFAISYTQRFLMRDALSDEDVAAAMRGLYEGALRFDRKRGVKFISYAMYWIRRELVALLYAQPIVRIPAYRYRKERRVSDAASSVNGVSAEPASSVWSRVVPLVVSTDETFGEKGDLVREIPDDRPRPDEIIEADDQIRRLDHLMGCLPATWRLILTMLYGLGDGEPMTLEEVGEIVGLSRERVRQIREASLARMRVPMTDRHVRLPRRLDETLDDSRLCRGGCGRPVRSVRKNVQFCSVQACARAYRERTWRERSRKYRELTATARR